MTKRICKFSDYNISILAYRIFSDANRISRFAPPDPHMNIVASQVYKHFTYQKLFIAEKPAALSGRLTAKPSGKFCIPIPTAKFLK